MNFKCIYISNDIIFYATGEIFRKKQTCCYIYHILLRKALLWLVNIVFIYFMLRKYGIVLYWMCTFRLNCYYHFRGGPCCKEVVFPQTHWMPFVKSDLTFLTKHNIQMYFKITLFIYCYFLFSKFLWGLFNNFLLSLRKITNVEYQNFVSDIKLILI